MTLVFEENDYSYGQDFRYYRRIPSGVEFDVSFFQEGRVILTGSGYGGKPYGNGALYANYGEFPKKLREILATAYIVWKEAPHKKPKKEVEE